jgi:hypothetical protein
MEILAKELGKRKKKKVIQIGKKKVKLSLFVGYMFYTQKNLKALSKGY